MVLHRGDSDNLTGNGIVYWNVEGENFIASGYEVFAINFIVSSLQLDNKLLTATFPPIPFQNVNALFDRLVDVQCDIIYGGDIKFPDTQKNFSSFYKNEFAKYNKIIEEYVECYKEKFIVIVEKLSEQEKLYMLKDIANKTRIELQEGGKTRLLFKKKIKKLTETLESNKYDLSNFKQAIFMPGKVGDELSSLYIKKFFAIFYEDYEDALLIKNEITVLEKHLNKDI